jgi:hypothetical protein
MAQREPRKSVRRPSLAGRVAKYTALAQESICDVALVRVCCRSEVKPTDVRIGDK